MSESLVVRAEAEEDIQEAFRWYESQQAGLGEDFINLVDDAFERIRDMPDLYRKIHGEIRRVFTRRFPYSIYYVVTEESISIIAVLNQRRNPAVWQKRFNGN